MFHVKHFFTIEAETLQTRIRVLALSEWDCAEKLSFWRWEANRSPPAAPPRVRGSKRHGFRCLRLWFQLRPPFNIEAAHSKASAFMGFRRKARFKSLRGKEQSISDGLVHIRQPDGRERKLRERLFTLLPQFRRSAHLRNRVVRDRPSISSSYQGEDASLVAIDGDSFRGSCAMCRADEDSFSAQHQSRSVRVSLR